MRMTHTRTRLVAGHVGSISPARGHVSDSQDVTSGGVAHLSHEAP